MKTFLSYKHDSNAPLIEKIKEYLSKGGEGNLRTATDSISQIKLNGEKYHECDGKKHYLWLSTRRVCLLSRMFQFWKSSRLVIC